MKNRKIEEIIGNAKKIAISGHIRPDGDCVGSSLGLAQYIKEQGLCERVDVFLGEIPKSFAFLEGSKEIHHEPLDEIYDLFFCLDCGNAERLEFSKPIFERAKRRFCIDHHVSEGLFTEDGYLDEKASSTSELVYGLLDLKKISKSVAEALFLGLIHDTGVFQYSCTAPSSHEMAANLLRKGIDAPEMIQKTYYEKTEKQNKILGKMLVESKTYLEGAMIVSGLAREDMIAFQVAPPDLNGIVSQLKLTVGVEVSLFYYEKKDGGYKISLRSGDKVDVNRVANGFGGGGHKKAAGFESSKKIQEIILLVQQKVLEQLG